MEKLNLNFFLRSGFKYLPTKKMEMGGLAFSKPYILKYIFTDYNSEFDELDTELIIFNHKSKYYLYYNNKIKKLKSIDDLKQFNLPYNKDSNYIYIISSILGYKIGKTKNISNRGNIFNVKLPFEWDFLQIYLVQDYNKIEHFLHQMLSNCRLNGEWFQLDSEIIKLIGIFIEQVP